MGKIYIDFDHSIVQFGCTECINCSSMMGKSLCSTKDRGCCSYFPEFTLHDIHKMVHTDGGMASLDTILGLPNAVVYEYHIHAKGHFDKEGYGEYINGDKLLEQDIIKDQTLFFRTCGLVNPGQGCSLPARFRPMVCNTFICTELSEKAGKTGKYGIYIDERQRYSSWIHWEDRTLQHILIENGVNLINDFEGTIEVLKGIPFNIYEFPQLDVAEF